MPDLEAENAQLREIIAHLRTVVNGSHSTAWDAWYAYLADRGVQDLLTRPNEDCVAYFEGAVAKARAEGYRAGQEAMKESVAYHLADLGLEREVRALPIMEETVTTPRSADDAKWDAAFASTTGDEWKRLEQQMEQEARRG